MERAILWTGIGGQSVQLAAQIVGRAAAREERHVMLLGTYGGTMRGGNTDCTLVVGDAPISTPPIVSRAWATLAMHDRFFAPLHSKLAPGGVAVVNDGLFETMLDEALHKLFRIRATEIATAEGSALGASLVLAGAFASLTELVSVDALVAAMQDSVPSYRRQHLESNERALRAGYAAAPRGAAPAWVDAEAAA